MEFKKSMEMLLETIEVLKSKLNFPATVDVYFLVLRLLTVAGGIVWYLVVPHDPDQAKILFWLLVVYAIYSYLLYAGIACWPGVIGKFYLTTLGVDLAFVFVLVRYVGELSGSFFIAFYLLVAIHSFYFGFKIGIAAALLSSLLYGLAYFDLAASNLFPWSDFLLRITFLFLIATSLSLLAEREKGMRKRVEELNRELARKNSILEQTYRHLSIGKLIGDIAAGINNPCGIVAARSEILMHDARAMGLPPAFVKGLEAINRCSHKVAQVIKSLMTFSKQKGFDMKRLDLNLVLNETLLLMQREFEERGVEVRKEFMPRLPMIEGDPYELKGVLMNLIGNALDALPKGGTIGIATQLNRKENGGEVICTISDDGIGIPEKNLEKIFNPFFTTKSNTGGIGLGLSTSLGVIKKHNGLITVKSKPGEGTSFSLSLPACEP